MRVSNKDGTKGNFITQKVCIDSYELYSCQQIWKFFDIQNKYIYVETEA